MDTFDLKRPNDTRMEIGFRRTPQLIGFLGAGLFFMIWYGGLGFIAFARYEGIAGFFLNSNPWWLPWFCLLLPLPFLPSWLKLLRRALTGEVYVLDKATASIEKDGRYFSDLGAIQSLEVKTHSGTGRSDDYSLIFHASSGPGFEIGRTRDKAELQMMATIVASFLGVSYY